MKKLVFSLLAMMPVQGAAGDLAGYDISSKQYAELVENIAKCTGYFTAASERAFELQFEIDDIEFSDEALLKGSQLMSVANKSMLKSEEDLPLKHREYLNEKRGYVNFGFGYGGAVPASILARDLRECIVQAELIVEE